MSNPIQLLSTDNVTAIVDGVSDMFRIVASGTVSTSGSGTGTAQGSVTIASGQTSIPVVLGWLEFLDSTTGQNAGEPTPNLVLNGPSIAYMYELWAELTGVAGQVKVVAQTTATSAGSGGLSGTYRYYLMQQVTF